MELFTQIRDIKGKAAESEAMVRDITRDIKQVCQNQTSDTKYRRSGVPTWDSSSRRISKLCNLSRVEAESENWRIEVELLDL